MSTLVVTITINTQEKSYEFFSNLDENSPNFLADFALLNAATQEVSKEINQKTLTLLSNELGLADSKIKYLESMVNALTETIVLEPEIQKQGGE